MPSNSSFNGFDAVESGFAFQESPEYQSFHLEGDWESFDEEYPTTETLSVENMTLGEVTQLLDSYQESLESTNDAEIAPLVAGLISAAPAIIQGVSGLVQSFSRPRQSAPPRSAPPPAPRQSPPPRHTPPTRRQVPAPPPRPMVSNFRPPTAPATGGGTDIAALLGLLQNSQILNAIQSLSTSGTANELVGNTDVPVSSVLNTIGQLASSIGNMVAQESAYYPEFYFDSVGNLLVDPASPESVGELILEKLNH